MLRFVSKLVHKSLSFWYIFFICGFLFFIIVELEFLLYKLLKLFSFLEALNILLFENVLLLFLLPLLFCLKKFIILFKA
jgi:hypothetical protein